MTPDRITACMARDGIKELQARRKLEVQDAMARVRGTVCRFTPSKPELVA